MRPYITQPLHDLSSHVFAATLIGTDRAGMPCEPRARLIARESCQDPVVRFPSRFVATATMAWAIVHRCSPLHHSRGGMLTDPIAERVADRRRGTSGSRVPTSGTRTVGDSAVATIGWRTGAVVLAVTGERTYRSSWRAAIDAFGAVPREAEDARRRVMPGNSRSAPGGHHVRMPSDTWTNQLDTVTAYS